MACLPDDLELTFRTDKVMANTAFQQKCYDIRNTDIKWKSYLNGQMITQVDYDLMTKFPWVSRLDESDKERAKRRRELLSNKEDAIRCVRTLTSLMKQLSKDLTIQYILILIDDLLFEEKTRVEIFNLHFREKDHQSCKVFLNMLDHSDQFIAVMSARILTKLACWSQKPCFTNENDLVFFMMWLGRKIAESPDRNVYLDTCCRCLQMLLRIPHYRVFFASGKPQGLDEILRAFDHPKLSAQVKYQLVFCIWCLTFSPQLIEMVVDHNVISILADILNVTETFKVRRIILAVFRNLLEKLKVGCELVKKICLLMFQGRVNKQLEILSGRNFGDEEFESDIEFLQDFLHSSVQDLTSFDEFSTEINSGRLSFQSPVHKDEKFWRENVMRLNENNRHLLKMLIALLERGDCEPMTRQVACHDIGQYVRYYPAGKPYVEELGGKYQVMRHLEHTDPTVKYYALQSLQKMLVQRWEYLNTTPTA